MARSRKNPDRKKNLQKFKEGVQIKRKIKNKISKIMSERNEIPQNGLPEIRQSPVWNSDAMLEISGAEWEAIFNFIEGSSSAFMAANAVMSRNIINGKVKMKFEKLNKETLLYENMTTEEEKPYQDEVQKAIKAAKDAYEKTQKNSEEIEPPSQEGLPRIDALVDAQGNEIKS